MYDQPIGEITEGTVGVGRRPCDRRRSPDHNAPIYGELLVLGWVDVAWVAEDHLCAKFIVSFMQETGLVLFDTAYMAIYV